MSGCKLSYSQAIVKSGHFINGLKCKSHVHGATCSVDTLLEIFHHGIFGKVKLDHFRDNPLLSALVNTSTVRDSLGPICDLRETVWDCLIQHIPAAFFPKGRRDAEILQGFNMLGQNSGSAFVSSYNGLIACTDCGRNFNKTTFTSAVLHYDQTMNARHEGDLSTGIEMTIQQQMKHQFHNGCCPCGSSPIHVSGEYNMSDIMMLSFGLTGEARNGQQPPLVVHEEMEVFSTKYTLIGAVQMGLGGGHFVAIVRVDGVFRVLDDCLYEAQQFPTFAAAVSRSPSDLKKYKQLDPSDPGIHMLFYVKSELLWDTPKTTKLAVNQIFSSGSTAPKPSELPAVNQTLSSVMATPKSAKLTAINQTFSSVMATPKSTKLPAANQTFSSVMATPKSTKLPAANQTFSSVMATPKSTKPTAFKQTLSSEMATPKTTKLTAVNQTFSSVTATPKTMKPTAVSQIFSSVTVTPKSKEPTSLNHIFTSVSATPKSVKSSSHAVTPSPTIPTQSTPILGHHTMPAAESGISPIVCEPENIGPTESIEHVSPNKTHRAKSLNLTSFTSEVKEGPEDIDIFDMCGVHVPYGVRNDSLYFSCLECFSAAGIGKHISSRGYGKILDILSKQIKKNDTDIFLLHRRTRWIRDDALLLVLENKDHFPRAQKKKAVATEDIKKLQRKRMKVQLDSGKIKLRRKLENTYPCSSSVVEESILNDSAPPLRNAVVDVPTDPLMSPNIPNQSDVEMLACDSVVELPSASDSMARLPPACEAVVEVPPTCNSEAKGQPTDDSVISMCDSVIEVLPTKSCEAPPNCDPVIPMRDSVDVQPLHDSVDRMPPDVEMTATCDSVDKGPATCDSVISMSNSVTEVIPKVEGPHESDVETATCNSVLSFTDITDTGKIELLGKDFEYAKVNNKMFLDIYTIFGELELLDRVRQRGYTTIDGHLKKAGFDVKSCFIFKYRERTHVWHYALLKIVDVMTCGNKEKKKRIKEDIILGLEKLAMKLNSSKTNVGEYKHITKGKSCLETFVLKNYGQEKQKFLSQLSNMIGKKMNSGFEIDKHDMLFLLNKCKQKIVIPCVQEVYRNIFPVTAQDTINLAENNKGTRLMDGFRKLIPGILPSQKLERDTKKEYVNSFNNFLLPRRTSTGWRIDPSRLVILFRIKYPYLGNVIHLKTTGDGREYGGRHSTFISLNILNDELLLNDVSYQSPKEFFPVALFYESDSRDNLEQNLTKPNFLNDFFSKLKSSESPEYKVYLAADEMFTLNVLDGSGILSPLSQTAWNLYSCVDIEQKCEVASSGRRTDLPVLLNRDHPENIMSHIELNNIVFCILHGLARCVEKLLNLEIQNIMSEKSKLAETSSIVTGADLIQNLEANVNLRGVKQSNFRIHFDKTGKPEPVSFNKDSAYAIISEAPAGHENRFLHILHNVLPNRRVTCTLRANIVDFLKLPDVLTEFSIVSMIWESLRIMFDILKTEPSSPETRLRDGAPTGSLHPKDYKWGYSNEQIELYKFHAERYYQLFCMRYSYKNLTPYMLKFIDLGPYFMKNLEIPICRFQAEGSEHLNYDHNCYYYSHTTRHGGKHKVDPLLALFHNTWRRFCYAIESGSKEGAASLKLILSHHNAACVIQKYFRGFLIRKRMSELGSFKDPKSRQERLHNFHLAAYLTRTLNHTVPVKNQVTTGVFDSLTFVLAGSVTKYKNKRYTHAAVEKLIIENGGKVKKKIPGKLKGRSNKQYIIMFDRAGSKSKIPNLIKESISRGYSVIKYQYLFDCLEEKCIKTMSEYTVDLGSLPQKLTREPSLQKQHFNRDKTMVSLIKKARKKKRCLPLYEKDQKCARNVAVYYAIHKRKELVVENGKMSFSENASCLARFMRQWKTLPLVEKETYQQRYAQYKENIKQHAARVNMVKSYNSLSTSYASILSDLSTTKQ